MAFEVIRGDIRNCIADAIVIPANPKPIIGKGVDRLIYHEAGRNRLLKERRKIGDIDFGLACITDAYDLRDKGVKYIIHAVSPAYDGGKSGERDLLRACYTNALTLAFGHGCKTVVFPLLSTGVLGYPKKEAQEIAESACKGFCLDHKSIDVTLVLYRSEEAFLEECERVLRYVEENSYSDLDVEDYKRKEKEWGNLPDDREERMVLELMRKRYARKQADEAAYREFLENQKRPNYGVTFYISTASDVKDYLHNYKWEPNVSAVLDEFIKNSDIKNDKDLAERAMMRIYTISRLRTNDLGEKAKRDCLWAISSVLGLDDEERTELFASAGLCIRMTGMDSKTERRERAIEYLIKKKNDLEHINEILNELGMAILSNDPKAEARSRFA